MIPRHGLRFPYLLTGLSLLTALCWKSGLAYAQGKEVRIAHVYDKTGPLEAYAKQTQTGFMLGLGLGSLFGGYLSKRQFLPLLHVIADVGAHLADVTRNLCVLIGGFERFDRRREDHRSGAGGLSGLRFCRGGNRRERGEDGEKGHKRPAF